MGQAIADLLFPPRCVGCHGLGAWLCGRCLATVEAIRPPVCDGCGWPLPQPVAATAALCPRCHSSPFQLDGLRAFGFHSHTLRTAIHEFKYEGLYSLAAPLGQAMSQAWPELAPNLPIDVIVPVPLHASRERERGYDQAALLAGEVGRGLGCPVVTGCLIRTRRTRPQVGLDAAQRQANVADAFACAPGRLSGRQVLLIDDVCTTGATLEAAAAALRGAGARAVRAYTLARAR